MLKFGAGAQNAGDFIPFDGRGRSLAQARRYQLAPRVNQNPFRCCATIEAAHGGTALTRVPLGLRALDPIYELVRRERGHLEAHVGEAIAAELRGESLVCVGLIRPQLHLGGHAGHRVDWLPKRRHEERVHDRGRGETEAHRLACSRLPVFIVAPSGNGR
jgi:hypothetical protein